MYTEGSWGYINDADSSIMGAKTSDSDSIYGNGWWAKSGKNCEYVLPLAAGDYSLTGYFAEWWSVTRPMKCYVTYKDKDGKTVTSDAATLTLSGSNAKQTATVNFTVANVDETAEVHFVVEKTGSSDPVIAGLSVKSLFGKVSSITLDKTAETIKIGDRFTLTVTVAPSTAENTKVIYHSSNEGVVSVNKYTGEVVANAIGKAVVTATARDGGGASASCEITVTRTGTVDISQIYGDFISSGSQSDSSAWLIATNNIDDEKQSAAYSSETATMRTVLGSPRIGCLTFELPETLDKKMIKSATVVIDVASVNQNLGDTGMTKAGLFAVDVDPAAISKSDPDTYPAKNNDYSAGATAFNKEFIGKSSLGKKTFDVTDMLLENKTNYAIFRMQTVSGGFSVINSGDTAPYLAIELYDTLDEVLAAEAESITIEKELSKDLVLPSSTKRGSTITWKSSDTSVISDDGKIFAGKTVTLKLNYSAKLKSSLAAAGLSVKSVSYTSGSKSIAKVTSSGKVTGLKSGKTTIKATKKISIK